jgi:hypothetical protein
LADALAASPESQPIAIIQSHKADTVVFVDDSLQAREWTGKYAILASITARNCSLPIAMPRSKDTDRYIYFDLTTKRTKPSRSELLAEFKDKLDREDFRP